MDQNNNQNPSQSSVTFQVLSKLDEPVQQVEVYRLSRSPNVTAYFRFSSHSCCISDGHKACDMAPDGLHAVCFFIQKFVTFTPGSRRHRTHVCSELRRRLQYCHHQAGPTCQWGLSSGRSNSRICNKLICRRSLRSKRERLTSSVWLN